MGSYYGNLCALDAATGALKWSFDTEGSIQSSAAFANGLVYVTQMKGPDYPEIIVLDATTGTLKWRDLATGSDELSVSEYLTDFSYSDLSPPTVANGLVYVSVTAYSVFGNLTYFVARDAATGAPKWATGFNDTNISSAIPPAVANGVVYTFNSSDNLEARDAATGSLKWSCDTLEYFDTPHVPVVSNGLVYVRGYNGQFTGLHALDAATGTIRWSYDTGYCPSSPAVAKGVVYVGSDNGKLNALDATTGALKWSCFLGSVYCSSSPAVANGVVYILSNYQGDHFFYGLDAATGAIMGSYSLADISSFSPVAVNGRVYVSSGDGLHCFSLDPGDEILPQPAPRPDPTRLVPDYKLKSQVQK